MSHRLPECYKKVVSFCYIRFALINVWSSNEFKAANLHIFTDGSKSALGVGGGYVIYSQRSIIVNNSFRLHDLCSVFQAELLAIQLALLYLNRQDLIYCQAAVLTDSQSAIQAIINSDNRHPIVLDTIKEINSLFAHHIIVGFTWIPCHSGITGNEVADSFAREEAASNTLSIYNLVPISAAVKSSLDLAWKCWSGEWNNLDNRHLKLFVPHVNRTQYILSICNFQTTQFMTNYGNFGDYLLKKKLCLESTCLNCLSPSDYALHLLFDCPYFNRERNVTIAKNNILSPNDLKSIVNKPDSVNSFKNFCSLVMQNRNSTHRAFLQT